MLTLKRVGKVWYIIGTSGGMRVRRSTKCHAWDEALEKMAELNEGLVKEGVLPRYRALVFGDLVSMYRGGKAKGRVEVSVKTESVLSRVLEVFGSMGVREFGVTTPMDRLDDVLWDKSEGTKKKYMGMLSAVWNYCAKRGKVKAMAFENGYRDGRIEEYIDEGLRGRILSEVKGGDHRASEVLEFLFLTGLRYSEMQRMGDVSVDGVKVYNFKGGNGRKVERVVPLNERAREIVASGVLKGLSAETSWLRGKLRAACVSLGEPKWRVHDARHSFASVLVNKGVDLGVVRDLLGHSSVTTTERYAKVGRAKLADAVSVL